MPARMRAHTQNAMSKIQENFLCANLRIHTMCSTALAVYMCASVHKPVEEIPSDRDTVAITRETWSMVSADGDRSRKSGLTGCVVCMCFCVAADRIHTIANSHTYIQYKCVCVCV